MRFDLSSLIGLLVAGCAIFLGLKLEGGHMSSIAQPTAALVVLGGTLGAIVTQFPVMQLRRLLVDLRRMFNPAPSNETLLGTLMKLANKARRDSIIALDRDLQLLDDAFLRRGLELAVDGVDIRVIRETLERELDRVDELNEQSAKVLESAGGYAPTVGILGAVLGLIHVMERLSEPSHLGAGIAVAFVSTVYGVGFANLVLLPLAGRLKARARQESLRLELALEGVIAIAEKESPRALERRLAVYVDERRNGADRAHAKQAVERLRSAA